MPTAKDVAIGGAVFVGGAVVATVGAPILVGAVGFGAGGIASGSLAASAMSAAMTNGFGMAAVSLCQSVGAAGISAASAAAAGATSTGVFAGVKAFLNRKKAQPGQDQDEAETAEIEKEDIGVQVDGKTGDQELDPDAERKIENDEQNKGKDVLKVKCTDALGKQSEHNVKKLDKTEGKKKLDIEVLEQDDNSFIVSDELVEKQ